MFPCLSSRFHSELIDSVKVNYKKNFVVNNLQQRDQSSVANKLHDMGDRAEHRRVSRSKKFQLLLKLRPQMTKATPKMRKRRVKYFLIPIFRDLLRQLRLSDQRPPTKEMSKVGKQQRKSGNLQTILMARSGRHIFCITEEMN